MIGDNGKASQKETDPNRTKHMERDSRFINRKTVLYCQDVSSAKLDLQIQHMPTQTPMSYLVGICELILKFTRCRGKRFRVGRKILKNKAEGLTLSNFKTNYKSTAVKTLVAPVEEKTARPMEQKSPESDPCKYHHLSFAKGANALQSLFKKWCWTPCVL